VSWGARQLLDKEDPNGMLGWVALDNDCRFLPREAVVALGSSDE
jgi:hypothetical protein